MTKAEGATQLEHSRWGWQSLRLRVMLSILLWVAFGIAGIWFSATRLFERHVEAQYHEELSVHVRELADIIHFAADGSGTLTRPLSDPRYLEPLSGFYWQVSIDGGQTLKSASLTRGALDEHVAHSPRILHVIERGPTGPAITYGFVRKGPQGKDVHFLIATDKRLLDAVVDNFTRELTAWLFALAIALIATGLAIVALGFRPFDRLAQGISALRSGRQSTLAGSYPSEIAPLVNDLNAFIDHNAKAVTRGRIEAGNLAHFVRTPLAVIIDEAERLALSPQTEPSGETILEQSQLISQQVEFRMARARSSAGARPRGVTCRLSDIVPPIVSAMRRLYPDIEFSLESSGDSEAAIPMERVDCNELISILIDNAGKWARQKVHISVSSDPDRIISISDDGPGMTPEELLSAFDVGTRFDPSKPGSGLGLAIARDIAAQNGLNILLSLNSQPDTGLTAILSYAKKG